MNDPISRQDAIDIVSGYAEQYSGYIGTPNDSEVYAYARSLLLSIERNIRALSSAEPERNGWVHIDDIYRLISGHSNYHGDNILAALTCLAEGKEVLKPITVLDAQPERKKGTWISEAKGKEAILDEFGNVTCSAHCSECGDWLTASDEYSCRGRYCPNCGADMKGEQNEDN